MATRVSIVKVDSNGNDIIPLNIDNSGNVGVNGTPSSTVVSGTVQATISSGTAVILGTQACSEVTIQAPAANTATVVFGSSTTTCYMELAAGRDFTIPVSNVNLIYVKSAGAATQTVNWIART